MAEYYGVSSDIIALADGRVPDDVLRILAEHPGELERLRDKYSSDHGDVASTRPGLAGSVDE